VVNHKESLVRIAGALIEIHTEHFLEYKSRVLLLHQPARSQATNLCYTPPMLLSSAYFQFSFFNPFQVQ
jgi:hypothetical protein